jgi:hypothetical protein
MGWGARIVSSTKPKAKSSVNQQVKAGIAAVRDFLAGRSGEAKAAHSTDKATREVVAAELLTAMAGRDVADETKQAAGDRKEDRGSATDGRGSRKDAHPQGEAAEATQKQEQERARQLFLDDGYFDETVETLRTASTPSERVAAAKALGLVGSQRATAHLIAAMFDEDAEVRTAAEEALAKLGDTTAAKTSPDVFLKQAKDSEKSKVTEVSAAMTEDTSGTAVVEEGVQDARASARVEEAASTKVAGDSGRGARVAGKTDEAATSKSRLQDTGAKVEQPAVEAGSKTAQARTHAKAKETAAAKSKTSGQASRVDQAAEAAPQTTVQVPPVKLVADPNATKEEHDLLMQEQAVRTTVEQLHQQIVETIAAHEASVNETRWRAERETKLRNEAVARRREEEELRKQAEQEAERRRLQEIEAVKAEILARSKAEEEAHRLAEGETRLRLDATALRHQAEELARKRTAMALARMKAAEAAQLAEAQRARQKAEEQHTAEVHRLRSEEENLRNASAEATRRRAEVEAARERAERDAEKLLEAKGRMQTAEEARAKAEAERLKVEAELRQRMETQERLLTEARRHAEEEQARLEDEVRRHTEAETNRLAELEVMRTKAEVEAKQRAEREQQIRSQLDSLRIADAEVRKRIEDAEVRRRAAEDAYRLVAEKVQRVETEAHASALEEEQIISKLETERRNVANEALARSEQERRIKEEIEMFRRLEQEERPRIEEATLQRTSAETRLQELRERLNAEEEARQRAEEQIKLLEEYQRRQIAEPVVVERQQDTLEELAPVMSAEGASAWFEPVLAAGGGAEIFVAEGTEQVPPAIASYLHSVDPYKRAAAVAELARSHAKDAFEMIAHCFDDHSPHVRNAAARALRKLEPNKTVDLFNKALDESSDERRRNIGSAIAASGLAAEAIDNLVSDNREATYNALSILFVMAKTGEVQPLVQAIEEHENDEVCRAVIKLLTLSGQGEVGDAALQRRVMGVAASRQKAGAARQEGIPDFRLRIAEVEVKRAVGKQQPGVGSPQTADTVERE